jgi:hypothetical protein
VFFENFTSYNSSVIKVMKRKQKWRDMPLQRDSLSFLVILMGEQQIRGLIWNLDFDEINHNNNDLFFQGGCYIIALVSF